MPVTTLIFAGFYVITFDCNFVLFLTETPVLLPNFILEVIFLSKSSRINLILAAVLSIPGLFIRFAYPGCNFIARVLFVLGGVFAVCAILSAEAKNLRLSKITCAARTGIYFLLSLSLAVFSVIEIPIVSSMSGDEITDPCSYVIVLGAGLIGDKVSLTLKDRLETTLIFLNDNPDTIAVVSGGRGDGETVTEAKAMRDWLISRGIDETRIISEEHATSTRENIDFSVILIAEHNGGTLPDKIAIISSDYHMYRSKSYLREYIPEPYAVSAKTSLPLVFINYTVREAFATAYMWVFG